MDTVHECDRQTDRRTDGRTDRITITNTVQRIASYGNNADTDDKLTFIVLGRSGGVFIRGRWLSWFDVIIV